MPVPESKTCTKCGETKPLSEFGSNGRDRWRSDCKSCFAAYVRARYHADLERSRERGRARNRRRYRADPEKYKAVAKEWREANSEKHLAWSIAWAKANRDKVREYKRKYDRANPDKKREAVRRRRARKAGNGTETYSELAIYERDGGRCVHCGVEIPLEPRSGWHIDHIVPISLGGPDKAANVQLSCPACNWAKWARLEGQIHFAV